jgi:hypothetical protein
MLLLCAIERNNLQGSPGNFGAAGGYRWRAMGGVLEIRAVFPDGDVRIDLLNHLR